MRLLLVGAFPYPQRHGSQIYFQEQAIALRSAGAEISLLTYGTPTSPPAPHLTDRAPEADPAEPDRQARLAEYWRALDGFTHLMSPKWSSPASKRSGPNWSKPLADAGLILTLRDAVASRMRHDPSHDAESAFDAILTHNAEATLAAIHGLRGLGRTRPPVVYCAHTLFGRELSTYLKSPKKLSFSSNPGEPPSRSRAGGALDGIGGVVDRWIARRADGWIALTQSAERVMRQCSTAPGALIPPSVPDPDDASPVAAGRPGACLRADPPGRLDGRSRVRLDPDRYFLYSGNLDGYQEIDLLAAVARRRSGRNPATGRAPMPIVVATHADHREARWREGMPEVEFRRVESSAQMQALVAGARASLLMRRTEGGFPIKLVNSLAAGTPPIAYHDAEWGLEHERDSLICSPADPVDTMLAAIDRLESDDDLARRLSDGARRLYLDRHQPASSAQRTLALVEEVIASHSGG